MSRLIRWMLCGQHDRPQKLRVIITFAVTGAMAVFGTVLVTLTPSIGGAGWVRGGYVLFVVMFLKLPLIFVLWWLIARNPEWPGAPPTWTRAEQAEILDYISNEAKRVRTLPDALERLEYLSQEAWHVADRLEDHAKVDALTVALHVDLMAQRARRERARYDRP
mgnify:CR=1 FL=1